MEKGSCGQASYSAVNAPTTVQLEGFNGRVPMSSYLFRMMTAFDLLPPVENPDDREMTPASENASVDAHAGLALEVAVNDEFWAENRVRH